MQHDLVTDTKALCRVCMTSEMEHSANLYDPFPFGQNSLHEMLREICAPVFAKSGPEDTMPEMPTKVCMACRNATVAAYSLHLQCIETDRRLGELVALMWELQEPGGDMVVEYGGDPVASSSKEVTTVQEEPIVVSVDDSENENSKEENSCLECGKAFATRWTLIRHKRDGWCDKTNDPKQRTCEMCNKVLRSVHMLKRHREMQASSPGGCYGAKAPPEKLGEREEEGKEEGREMHGSIESDVSSLAPELPATAQELTAEDKPVEMLKVEALDLMEENENEDSLLEEVVSQHTDCSQCGISFSSIRAYREHTQEGNCQRTNTYPCRICGKVFDKLSRRQYHMYSHRERVACTRCDETFRNKGSLKVHISRKRCSGNKLNVAQAKLEIQAEEQDYPEEPGEEDVAEETPKGDTSAEGTEYAEEQDQMMKVKSEAEEEKIESLEDTVQSPKGDTSVERTEHSEQDQDQMQGEEDEVEEALESDTSEERTESIDIQCTDCGVSFLSKIAHRRHTQEGNCQQKPTFPCKICGKIFDKLTRMTYHYYTHKERFPCSMCGEQFKSEHNLQQHLNRCSALRSSPAPEEDGMNEPLIEQALVMNSDAFRDPLLTSEALDMIKVEEPGVADVDIKLESEIIVEPIPVNDGKKTCHICSEIFDRRLKYRFHMQRNHQLHVCGRCYEIFDTEQILADHKNTNHPTVAVDCPKCDKSFESQRALQRHKKDGSCPQEPEQTPKPFQCDLCEKSFDTALRLGYHKNNHGNRIYCDNCGRQLQSKAALRLHIARGICLGDMARTCLACKKVFDTVLEYKKHRQEAHPGPVDCPDCGRKLTSLISLYVHIKDGRCESIRNRITTSEVNRRTCKICAEVQVSVSKLRAHMRAKHLDKIFPCDSCHKHFPTKEKFDAHIKKHDKNLVNICQICNTGFPTLNALKRHRFTHVPRVKCALCDKDFRNTSDLKVHMTIHTGEKAYTCDLCPMRFRTAGRKKCHMETTHSTQPDKVPTAAVCEQCGRKFTSPATLKAHINAAHKGLRPHACTQCDLKFARSRQLARHKLTHTKERPFKCQVCPQAYLECSELVKHVARAHGDGNPYACDRCDKSFRFIAELRKHYAEHAQDGFDPASGATDVRFTSLALLNMRFAKEKQQEQAEDSEESDDSD